MRLLFVHDRFGAQAGAESNLQHTAAELKRRGHEVGLVHGPGTGRGEQAWRGIFPFRSGLEAGDAARGVRSALAEFRPEAVYLHNSPDVEAVAALAQAAVPVVRMVHDHQLFCLRGCKYPAWSRRPCLRALSPYCVFPCGGAVARDRAGGWPLRWVSYLARKKELELHRRFHRLLVASRYMREELLRNGIAPERIEIHAPVPPPAETDAPEPTFGARNLIVYAGQLVRGKGVDVLLEALALMREPFECVILGDGHHRPACEALSRRLGLAGCVHFPGYVPQAELSRYYQEATVAVVSSVWPEPFGATGLEALRHGLPVIAFDVGGIGDWLRDGENGFLVPWMDRVEFAACLELLLTDKPMARRLGARGRALAAERFNFDRYVSGLERMFVRAATAPSQEAAA